jgi:hypothetical protein
VKELEDYSWFPSLLRNFQVEYIGFVAVKLNIYELFIDHLQTLPQPMQTMTDLCSGSGEPAISIFRKSGCFTHLTLSDKFPISLKLNDEQISDEIQKIDVLKMEFKHGTCYTMFNSFHHFKDAEKLKIIHKIQKSGSDAFIVEVLQPTIYCFFKIVITTTIGVLFLTPFIAPFSFKRLFFTYIIPLNILTITFDGIVSVFKSRSVKQYQKMFANSENKQKIYKLINGRNTLIVIQIGQTK